MKLQDQVKNTDSAVPEFTHIISIDNGTTGGLGVMAPTQPMAYYPIPVKKERSYTKEEHFITRIDTVKLRKLFSDIAFPADKTEIIMERPFVNPRMFRATLSAIRALEATLVVIEEFGFYLRYIDSKEWQSILLPGVDGRDALKKASLKLGKKLYPDINFKKDADAVLIAHWAKHKTVRKKEL